LEHIGFENCSHIDSTSLFCWACYQCYAASGKPTSRRLAGYDFAWLGSVNFGRAAPSRFSTRPTNLSCLNSSIAPDVRRQQDEGPEPGSRKTKRTKRKKAHKGSPVDLPLVPRGGRRMCGKRQACDFAFSGIFILKFRFQKCVLYIFVWPSKALHFCQCDPGV